jgi:hypothetical protein
MAVYLDGRVFIQMLNNSAMYRDVGLAVLAKFAVSWEYISLELTRLAGDSEYAAGQQWEEIAGC